MNFEATEGLRKLAESGRVGEKYEAADGLRAERTARELRLTVASASTSEAEMEGPVEQAIAAASFSAFMDADVLAAVDGWWTDFDYVSLLHALTQTKPFLILLPYITRHRL